MGQPPPLPKKKKKQVPPPRQISGYTYVSHILVVVKMAAVCCGYFCANVRELNSPKTVLHRRHRLTSPVNDTEYPATTSLGRAGHVTRGMPATQSRSAVCRMFSHRAAAATEESRAGSFIIHVRYAAIFFLSMIPDSIPKTTQQAEASARYSTAIVSLHYSVALRISFRKENSKCCWQKKQSQSYYCFTSDCRPFCTELINSVHSPVQEYNYNYNYNEGI